MQKYRRAMGYRMHQSGARLIPVPNHFDLIFLLHTVSMAVAL